MTTPPHRPTLSVVAPVFNEEAILHELYRRLRVVLINDGSRDRSLEIMRELHAADERVKVVSFARNFGHQVAITAGADYAQGEAVCIIDADLQDPPEVILDLLAKWREGYEVIYAVRSEREGETWFKEFTAKAFYRIIYRITDINIPMDTGDFRLMDRRVVQALRTMREKHRFMRGMSVWVGFKQTGVHYKRAARFAGETKYPLKKMLKFALDGITSFSYFPLQLATYIGFAAAALAVLGILITIILRLTGSHAFEGQASTLVAVLFLGGVQLISVGIIGEYLGRIYDEVKGRPLYIVGEALGFEEQVNERVAVR
ncbi:MAG: glycosyltransferase family 2 protein [Anaerolineae bacterium]|nr:glycosyltransferase family 2 protein [Anaerolineae bacterium]